jgi:hypothetical protein
MPGALLAISRAFDTGNSPLLLLTIGLSVISTLVVGTVVLICADRKRRSVIG